MGGIGSRYDHSEIEERGWLEMSIKFILINLILGVFLLCCAVLMYWFWHPEDRTDQPNTETVARPISASISVPVPIDTTIEHRIVYGPTGKVVEEWAGVIISRGGFGSSIRSRNEQPSYVDFEHRMLVIVHPALRREFMFFYIDEKKVYVRSVADIVTGSVGVRNADWGAFAVPVWADTIIQRLKKEDGWK